MTASKTPSPNSRLPRRPKGDARSSRGLNRTQLLGGMVGLLIVLVGLVLGLMPLQTNPRAQCGSAFAPAELRVGCSQKLEAQRLLAVVVIGVGVASGAMGILLAQKGGGDAER